MRYKIVIPDKTQGRINLLQAVFFFIANTSHTKGIPNKDTSRGSHKNSYIAPIREYV